MEAMDLMPQGCARTGAHVCELILELKSACAQRGQGKQKKAHCHGAKLGVESANR
jgi:hypothetical protein